MSWATGRSLTYLRYTTHNSKSKPVNEYETFHSSISRSIKFMGKLTNRSPYSTLLVLSLCVGFSLLFGTRVTTQSKKSSDGTSAAQQHPGNCRNLENAPAIFGVTITDLDHAAAATPYLQQLVAANGAVPVVVRVVFEPINESNEREFGDQLTDYQSKVRELRNDSHVCVLGTIADSYDMHFYLPDSSNATWPIGFRNYQRWTERLVRKMGALVDIWEIGNEVNGGMVGKMKSIRPIVTASSLSINANEV
jgi:hypothetical protein